MSILVLKVVMLDVFNIIEIHFLHLLLTKMCQSNSANNTELSMVMLKTLEKVFLINMGVCFKREGAL